MATGDSAQADSMGCARATGQCDPGAPGFNNLIDKLMDYNQTPHQLAFGMIKYICSACRALFLMLVITRDPCFVHFLMYRTMLAGGLSL